MAKAADHDAVSADTPEIEGRFEAAMYFQTLEDSSGALSAQDAGQILSRCLVEMALEEVRRILQAIKSDSPIGQPFGKMSACCQVIGERIFALAVEAEKESGHD